MSVSLLKVLSKLVNSYERTENLTASDFVSQISLGDDEVTWKQGTHAFLNYIKHEKFLESIATLFLRKHKFFQAKVENVKVQIYFVLISLDPDNMKEIINYSHYYTRDLLQFLLADDTQKFIAREGCKYFENEYILEVLIQPFHKKIPLIESVIKSIDEKHFIGRSQRKPTIPKEFKFRRKFKTPPVPLNTPEDYRYFRAKNPPLTTIVPQVGVLKKIEQAHLKNKEKAQQLLNYASSMSKHLTESKIPILKDIVRRCVPKATSVPLKKDVPIKENLTTTLREASRLLKQQEQEIKTIEDIIKGGCDTLRIEKLEENYRKEQELEELETIQKKRLEGLLSYEEAIIARTNLLENNKKNVEKIKHERAIMLEQLEEWKDEEWKKLREYIQMCQKSKKDIKEIERTLIEEKQIQVRLQQNKTKEMLRKAFEEKQKELAKKIELIREIKIIHQINMSIKREFNPNEISNMGLLCEMSIAELQERLVMTKLKIKDELNVKRQRILKKKIEQQQMIENVKNFIEQNRLLSKRKTVPIESPIFKQSPDLLKLKELLQEKRTLRLKKTFVNEGNARVS